MYDAFVARGLDPTRLVRSSARRPHGDSACGRRRARCSQGPTPTSCCSIPMRRGRWIPPPSPASPVGARSAVARSPAASRPSTYAARPSWRTGACWARRSRALRGDRRPAARTPRADGDHGDHHMTADVSLTRYVAEWSTELSADDIPQRTRDIAIRHVLDGYGLALSGHAEESHAILRRYVDSVGADGAVHVLGARPAHVRRARGARQRPRHARNGLRRHAVGDRP